MSCTFLSGVLFFFLCNIVFSSSIPHLCPKDQMLALIKFNKSLSIDPSHVLSYHYPKTSRWSMSRDCCLWDGVICDELTGHVIHLNLSYSGLVGKIDSNSSLFQLSHLQLLDLSLNNFSHSQISPEFGKFSNLTHLHLTNSYFSGQIPSEISHLSKLQSLYLWPLDDNELRLTAHDFEMLLQNLTQLRELALFGVNISSTIPTNISSHHITFLGLEGTGLYGIVPHHIFHLPNLEALFLDNNYQLSGCFPRTKWNSSASLVLLDLSGVKIYGGFPESLGYLTSLQDLSLDNCSLSGSIPQFLSNLTHLESLSLRDNQLQGHLPSSIQNQVNLTYPDLSSNNFSGNVDVSFFSNLTRLSSLDLSHNRISLTNENKVKVTLPESLRSIDLRSNLIQGSIPIIPLENITEFYISDNNLSGEIPLSICNSTSLKVLDLAKNILKGKIPECLDNISHLQVLMLSRNNLSEEIPSSICNLTSIEILDFGRNNLKGSIPQCFGNMTGHLHVLDLQYNNLSGILPTTFSNGSVLRSFNLRGNKLEGIIPPHLLNCKKLQVLDFGDNHLSDTFPMWLGNLRNLQVLSLRSNKLHGSVRNSKIGNMFPSLRILDLSYNAFTGNLPMNLFRNFKAMKIIDQTMKAPSYLGEWYYQDSVIVANKGLELELVRILTVYTTIDLSSNSFEGHIPSSVGDLIALHTLNLSHNRFQSHIPQSLGSLSSIESLDLSANQLSGEIPKQLASLTFLEVLNLSYNHLEGCIPVGSQFATFSNRSYDGNDGLRGFPLSKGCGKDRTSEKNSTSTAYALEDEDDFDFFTEFWKAALVGCGVGLGIGVSIVYFMMSRGYPIWLARLIVRMEHKMISRRRKKQRNQRNSGQSRRRQH